MGTRKAKQPKQSATPPAPSLDEAVAVLLERIDAERERLRALLARVPESAIAQRPPSGAWSVLENVRHLLYAEQLHLSRLVSRNVEWSPLGFTPATMRAMRKLPPVRVDTTPRLADVLEAWDKVHGETARDLANVPLVVRQRALERHLRHLRAHIRLIERLARSASK